MIRIPCLVCVATLLACSVQAAEPTLKKVIPTDSVQFARAFSTDLQVCTLIFEQSADRHRDWQGHCTQRSQQAILDVFTPESDGEVCIVQTIRGFVSTQAG